MICDCLTRAFFEAARFRFAGGLAATLVAGFALALALEGARFVAVLLTICLRETPTSLPRRY